MSGTKEKGLTPGRWVIIMSSVTKQCLSKNHIFWFSFSPFTTKPGLTDFLYRSLGKSHFSTGKLFHEGGSPESSKDRIGVHPMGPVSPFGDGVRNISYTLRLDYCTETLPVVIKIRTPLVITPKKSEVEIQDWPSLIPTRWEVSEVSESKVREERSVSLRRVTVPVEYP